MKTSARLTNGLVTAANALLREDNLPQLAVPGTETTGAHQKKISPHAIEPFIVFFGLFFQLVPVSFKIFVPTQECSLVVDAEVVPVLHHK